MKITRYTILTVLMVFFLNACQEVESPVDNIPTVTTGSVENIGSRYACLTGSITSPTQTYFMFGTSQDLSNATKVEAHISDNNNCFAEIEGLSGGTTYYYALCASDGRSEIIGNVLSFTTKSLLGIEKVSVEMWAGDGSVGFVPEDAIGTFLFDDSNKLYQDYGNMETYYRNSVWNLPYEIDFNDRVLKFYAYYPYNEKVGSKGFQEIPVMANGNNVDYLYGYSSNVDEDNSQAQIEMKHALSKIVFSITKSKSSDFSECITGGCLWNNASKAISWEGHMNIMTGKIVPIFYENDGIYRSCEFYPDTDNASNIEMFVIPTSFSDKEVVFYLNMGNYSGSVYLPASEWETGKQYVYPIEITITGLKLGDVQVEEWENNNSGSIIINK